MPSSSSASDEDVVPEPRLEVALHLGQIEVGAGAARQQLRGVVEEVEAEVEEAAGDRAGRRCRTCFSGRCQPRGRTISMAICSFRRYSLPSGLLKLMVRADRVAQVDLALDQVLPGRRVGVLEVGHEDLGAGVERVDDHLAVDRAGDLDPAILQIGGNRRDASSRLRGPRAVSGRKSGSLPGVERLPGARRAFEQRSGGALERRGGAWRRKPAPPG